MGKKERRTTVIQQKQTDTASQNGNTKGINNLLRKFQGGSSRASLKITALLMKAVYKRVPGELQDYCLH